MKKSTERRSSWTIPLSLLSALVTFFILHDATVIRREMNFQRRSHLYSHYSVASNERPFEYISKLFSVCIEAQTPAVISEAHIRAQKFLDETSIIRRTRHYVSYFREVPTEGLRKVSEVEKAFPLAFVHQIHTDVGIFEMLLSVIYRPHNYHCIHVDAKVLIHSGHVSTI